MSDDVGLCVFKQRRTTRIGPFSRRREGARVIPSALLDPNQRVIIRCSDQVAKPVLVALRFDDAIGELHLDRCMSDVPPGP